MTMTVNIRNVLYTLLVCYYCCCCCVVVTASGSLVREWAPDNINITSQNIHFRATNNLVPAKPGPHSTKAFNPFPEQKLLVTIAANGIIYTKEGGHFNINFDVLVDNVGQLVGTTDCIAIGTNQNDARDEVLNTPLEFVEGTQSADYFDFGDELTVSDVFAVTAKKYFDSKKFKTSYLWTFKSTLQIRQFSANFSLSECLPPRTIGAWSDNTRWSAGVVPTTHDAVLIPQGAGVIQLDKDIELLGGLSMYGGLILGMSYSCPQGWRSNPDEAAPSKCYRLYENKTDFASANQACSLSGYTTSFDGQLVEIGGYSELTMVKKLCRGNSPTSPAKAHGCWIGLQDQQGLGSFQWVATRSSNPRGFRDWRRFEPNNHTVAEGISTPGELCVAMVPWQDDPLHTEQGVFDDSACVLQKPYICQMFRRSQRFGITVYGPVNIFGGVISAARLFVAGPIPVTGSPTKTFHPSLAPSTLRPSCVPTTRSPSYQPTTSLAPTVTSVPTTRSPTVTPSTQVPTNQPYVPYNDLAFVGFRESAWVAIATTASDTFIGTVILEDGSRLSIDSSVFISNDSWIGELSGSMTGFDRVWQLHASLLPEERLLNFFYDVLGVLVQGASFALDRSELADFSSLASATLQPEVIIPQGARLVTVASPSVERSRTFNETYEVTVYVNQTSYPTYQPSSSNAAFNATIKPTFMPTFMPTGFLPTQAPSAYPSLANSPTYRNITNAPTGPPGKIPVIKYRTVTITTKYLHTAPYTVTINAAANIDGNVFVDDNVRLEINEGGRMSQGTFNITGQDSVLALGGYAAEMSTFDSFDLVLTHIRPVVGEYVNNTALEDQATIGVYRIIVTDHIESPSSALGYIKRHNITACIPYNATAQEVADYLSALPIIQARGGVTVRRYGDDKNAVYQYGFTHRIDLDSPLDEHFAAGPMTMEVYCYGILLPCGCADVKVSINDASGTPDCPTNAAGKTIPDRKGLGKSSGVNPRACVISPTISVNRVTTLSYANTVGLGTVVVEEGVHRLPHHSVANVAATGGRGMVAANFIRWTGLTVNGMGTLVFAGTSWGSWDSANVLFLAEWEYERGMSFLDSVPAFNMFATYFNVGGFGSLYSASPFSNMTWQSGNWTGGAIGGRSTIRITESLVADGDDKALRYSCTLWVQASAKMQWKNGNISLADGASIIMEGDFEALVVGKRQYIGQALLMGAPANNSQDLLLLSRQPGRDWHGYYDNTLPAELRGGWYRNPLCGGKCLVTNQFTVRQNGQVNFVQNSSAGFLVPLNLIGTTKVTIGEQGQVDFVSGGICGNDVVVDMKYGTVLTLSGGNFLMRARCTIKGQGELIVSSGAHDMAFVIDAHITIAGGTLLWPLSNGKGQAITFNGGLLMRNTGRLEIQPFSTTIKIYNGVILQDNCIIQFPSIGIAAQASPFDRSDAPDDTPRGYVQVNGTMIWNGGTIAGKADVNALVELYLDGTTKYIRSLAKLVNTGHCEWGSGDLIIDDNADFLNLGELQMRNGVNSFDAGGLYRGTILPVENGGDLFANNYHTYDQDQQHLSTAEYIRLRTLYVSRAPEGWDGQTQTTFEKPVPL